MQYNLFITNLCPGRFHCWMGGTTCSHMLIAKDKCFWIFCCIPAAEWVPGVASPLGPEEVAARSGVISLLQFFPQLTSEKTRSLHFKTVSQSQQVVDLDSKARHWKALRPGRQGWLSFCQQKGPVQPNTTRLSTSEVFFVFCFYCFFTYDLQWTGKRGGTGIKPVQKLIF